MVTKNNFPDDFNRFTDRYKINDSQRVYTNGINLIPVFRVKQWIDERLRANWIEDKTPIYNGYGNYLYKCSNCGYIQNDREYNYCPECGAKMEGGRR